MPTINPYYDENAIAKQYKLADALRNQPRATSMYGVLANGLGALGGNLVSGSADNALASNQAMRRGDMASAANSGSSSDMAKVLLGSQVPELQDLGFKTKLSGIESNEKLAQAEAAKKREYETRAGLAEQYGLAKGSPEWRGYVLTGEMKDPLDAEYKRAQINKLSQAGDGDFAQRAAAAQALGYDMNSDAAKSYILTGKMPREDQQALTATDKKAILEADEMTGSNRAAIQAIDEATRLNPEANAGWLAGARASVGANLPDWLVPDLVSSPKSAQATIDFDNAVVGQALTQLKSIFGGNPTEGERKILLDLQGSSGKPKEVRQEILSRARRAAVARLQLNEQRANELRGGTYYKPGGGSAAANPTSYNSAAGDPLAEARAAIASGAPRDAVLKRLQENGIDPAGL